MCVVPLPHAATGADGVTVVDRDQQSTDTIAARRANRGNTPHALPKRFVYLSRHLQETALKCDVTCTAGSTAHVVHAHVVHKEHTNK